MARKKRRRNMPCDVSVFFGMHRGGWSEVYHNQNDVATTFVTYLQPLINARLGCLAQPARLIGARVSNFTPPKQTRPAFYDLAGGMAPTQLSDYGSTACLTKMRGVSGASRSMFMRGIPDGIVIDGGILTPFATWLTPFNAWKAVITSAVNGWSNKLWITNSTLNPIIAMRNIAGRYVEMDLTTPVGLSLRGTVRIGSGGAAQGLQGRHRILALSVAGAITTVRIRSPYSVDDYVGSAAWMAGLTPTTDPILEVIPARVTSRKVGSPFGAQVGRRSPVRQG